MWVTVLLAVIALSKFEFQLYLEEVAAYSVGAARAGSLTLGQRLSVGITGFSAAAGGLQLDKALKK